MKLKDKICIVTGGASGIGKAICKSFAKNGATILVSDIDEENGMKTLEELKKYSSESIFIKTDVSKEQEVKNLTDTALKNFGKLDIMVNNAGVHHMGPITSLTEEIIDKLLSINVKGVIWGMKHAIPPMLEQHKGVIINLSSMSGIVGHPNVALYCATKGAILQITKSTALEYATKGIRINALCPGTIDTNIPKIIAKNSPDPEKTLKEFADAEPMKRMGKPEEVANGAVFLASDDASFMTGTCFLIDGGFTAGK